MNTFLPVEANACSLSEFILNALRKNRLDPQCIISKGYDGASVMSGHCAGVQRYICDVVPHAKYVHCYAHCLNLVLVDSTKRVGYPKHLIPFLSWKLSMCFCQEVLHMLFSSRNNLNYSQTVLNDTRWSCRFSAVDALCSTFQSVLATLEEIANGEDRSRTIEATGIWTQVQTFKFLVSLITFWRIFSCTKSLSDQLAVGSSQSC